jgi:hypothetical protein
MLAASFATDPWRCGTSDVFAEREGVQKVHQYFAGTTTIANHPVTTFLLQPRLSVCSAHPESASLTPDAAGDVNKGRQPDRHEPSLDLLVLVPCPPQAADRRAAIRHTWGSVARHAWPHSNRQWRVELFFLLGRPSANSAGVFNMTGLDKEESVHGDLLMADMLDSYRNLSLKMLAGLHWLTSHCDMQRVSHVLKADADTFVHVDLLLHVLDHVAGTQPTVARSAIFGQMVCTSSYPWDPRRYPFSSYPPYVSGGMYVLPGKFTPVVANASRFLPLLFAEDAFFTGLVAYAVDVPRVHMQGVLGLGLLRKLCKAAPCLLLGNDPLSATKLADTDVSVWLMKEMWRAVQAGPEYCEQNTSLWNRACKGLQFLADNYLP